MDGTDVVIDEKAELKPAGYGLAQEQKPAQARNGGWQGQKQQAQRNLQALLQQAADDVRARAGKLEESVFRPAGEWANDFAKARPVFAVFFAIFGILSAVPVLCFTGFALLSTVFLIGTSLSIAFLVLGFVLCCAGGILLLTLLFTVAASLFLTISLVSTFVAYRLVFHVRTSGLRDGVGGWAGETRGRLYGGVHTTSQVPQK